MGLLSSFSVESHLCTILGCEAIPHIATNDDEYDGYYIPKGTVVIGNAWLVRTTKSMLPILTFLFRSILHDPKLVNNPMEYDPERHLKDGKLNPDAMNSDSVAFGFGRRSVVI